MRCEEIRTHLAEYACGGLGRWRRGRVARHLTSCPGCRRELAAQMRTGALLSQVGLESAPEGTWEAIRHQLEAPARPRLQPLRPVRRLAAAAALALLVIFAGVLTQLPALHEQAPVIEHVVKVDRDTQSAEEGHLSATWSAPLSDPAAMGLRLESVEDNS